ncbi:efflux RND transporter periplasmic adaptor subunit [Bacteroidota bacterium]
MKRNLYSLIILLAVLAGCSPGDEGESAKSSTVADTVEQSTVVNNQMVRILELDMQMISRTIEYNSNLIPFRENHLASASPGRIDEIFVEIGDHVKKGDILVQMDRTQLHQATIQLKNVETDFQRLDTLNKVGGISKQQYEQVRVRYDIASSNAKFLQENTVLRAPFEGVISGKYYEDGEFYSGAPSTPTGKSAVVSMVQLDPLKAVVNISEKYFPMVRTGMDATVNCDIYPGKSFKGKVMRIYPTIDPANRSFTIEIKISNEKGLLRPGMFSRVSMTLGEEMALVLPSVTVLKLQGSNERYVFLEENGIARRVTVQMGKRFDDKVEVLSDELKPGSHLIVTGQARLVDGDTVIVVSE